LRQWGIRRQRASGRRITTLHGSDLRSRLGNAHSSHLPGQARVNPECTLTRSWTRCLEEAVVVLGIEGFRLTESEIRPDMRAIADFSGITDPRESVDEARSFFDEVSGSDLYFDFALEQISSPLHSRGSASAAALEFLRRCSQDVAKDRAASPCNDMTEVSVSAPGRDLIGQSHAA
jgi:hypothetical protein